MNLKEYMDSINYKINELELKKRNVLVQKEIDILYNVLRELMKIWKNN